MKWCTLFIMMAAPSQAWLRPSHSAALPVSRRVTAAVRGGAPLAVVKSGEGDTPPKGRGARKDLVLFSLAAVYASNQWCRSLLFSTVDFGSDDGFRFVNAAVGLSRSDYAVLGTLAFNVLFSACSLAAGAVVDRFDAAKLTWVSCGVWGLATVASGSCDGFATLAFCRAVQGVAELESSHIDGVELAILAVLDQRLGDAAQILLIVREVVQIEHVVGV